MWGAYSTVINTTLYISGGWCPNDTMNSYNVQKYELDKNQWSVLPPLQQYCGIPVNTDNKLTVIGGKHSATHKPTAQVTTFTDDRWNNDTHSNLSVARLWPAVVRYHQYVIVAGGLVDDGTVVDTMEILDVITRHWTIINTHLPEPMCRISVTVCADSVTIVGYHGADKKRSNGTFTIPIDEILSQQHTQQSLTSSTDKDDTKWHILADAPYWRTALVPNTSPPVTIGGNDKHHNTVNDITIYDDINNRWKKITSIAINCAWTTVAVINDCIIVMGGACDTKTIETANATALNNVNVGQLVLCD